ncbi:hypothetical protein BDC45DRAFT_283921 [Circinella umbellata]|nr:hypothetical protein BDC45DRAFT_283921 [Circinella umbellata]
MDPDPSSLNALIDSQFQDGDDITDIHEALMECIEADLDLEYCQNLIKRLLKLAIQTKSIKFKKFSNSLNDVFRRIVLKSPSIAEREARKLCQYLNELLNIKSTTGLCKIVLLSDAELSHDIIMNLIAIIWETIRLLLSSKQEAYIMELYTHIFFFTPKVIAIAENADKSSTKEFILETASTFHDYYSKKYLRLSEMKASEYLLSLLNGVQLVLLSPVT